MAEEVTPTAEPTPVPSLPGDPAASMSTEALQQIVQHQTTPTEPATPAPTATPAVAPTTPATPAPIDVSQVPEEYRAVYQKYGGDPVALAEAYRGIQSKSDQVNNDNAALRNEIGELKTLIQGGQQPNGDVATPGQPPTPQVPDPSAATNLDELMYSNPTAYTEALVDRATKTAVEKMSENLQATQQKQMVEDAKTHTQGLYDNRARELLLTAALGAQNQQDVQRYSNTNYTPTEKERSAVAEFLDPEIAFVENNVKRDYATFKHPDNALEFAQAVLYRNDHIKDAETRGAQRTLDQFDGKDEQAVVLSAKGHQAAVTHDLSKANSYEGATAAGQGLSNEDLKEAIKQSRP